MREEGNKEEQAPTKEEKEENTNDGPRGERDGEYGSQLEWEFFI